jgi:hypothetical protein
MYLYGQKDLSGPKERAKGQIENQRHHPLYHLRNGTSEQSTETQDFGSAPSKDMAVKPQQNSGLASILTRPDPNLNSIIMALNRILWPSKPHPSMCSSSSPGFAAG